MNPSLWRLEQLADLASAALATTLAGGESQRVQWRPNPRTVRYYTTLGLLDRPAEMRGRTAYYGRRHLLQVVAIKRLQAAGLSLGDIQIRLAGRTQDELEALAQLPGDLGRLPLGRTPPEGTTSGPAVRARAFWGVPPTPAPQLPAGPPPSGPDRGACLVLAPGVRLVVDGVAGALAPATCARLLQASRPLLAQLQREDLHSHDLESITMEGPPPGKETTS